ncbi:unnamed protein product [Effrenium voratum]|nr:unnamed protein product [Effrenium voratum]
MATSARGAELAEATGVAVVEMVEKEAAAAEVAVAEKAELAEATEVAVAEMAEKAKPAADTEAVAEMAETDLAAALEMAAAERSELAEAMGVAVAAEKDLAPATEVAVTESLLAAAAADDRATQALGARPGGSRTNTIAYTKEPVFLAEVANKVCADLLAPSELDAASSSKALAETTLSKAQTQLKKRLGPKAAKKSKAKTAAQPKAKPKAKPKAMPTPYVMKRHKRKHFTAFAINLDKQIMQAQSNQINNAEALVADLTAKLNNEAIAVQEAISELTAAKARGG